MAMKIFGLRVTWQRLVMTGTAAGLGTLALMEYTPKLLEAKRMRVSSATTLLTHWFPVFVLLSVRIPFIRIHKHECESGTITMLRNFTKHPMVYFYIYLMSSN